MDCTPDDIQIGTFKNWQREGPFDLLRSISEGKIVLDPSVPIQKHR
jgi:hypothetical protein